MGRSRVTYHEEHYPYFLTCTVVDGIIVFDDPEVAKIVLDSIQFLQDEFKVKVYGFVVMPNHMHMVVQSAGLSDKIRKFKSYTARKILDTLTCRKRTLLLKRIKKGRVTNQHKSEYQFWQEGSYPKQVDSRRKMLNYLDYIHNNPVKAGFVESPEHWQYSSVKSYLGLPCEFTITQFAG